jgi:hypothetical protein
MSQTPEAERSSWVQRIGEAVQDIVFEDAEVAGEGEGEGEESLRSQVGTLLPKLTSDATGKLQVLGLTKIRRRFGDRWPEVCDWVHATVDRTIKKRLTSADVCMRAGEEGYVILFGELARREAEFKCVAIAGEVAEQILGQREAAAFVEVKTVVGEVDGRAVVEDVDPVAGLENVIESKGQSSTGKGAATAGGSAAAGLRCSFRPIWDVQRGALLAYNCEPALESGKRPWRLGSHASQRGAQRDEIIKFDQFMLCEAARTMRHLARINRRFLLSCCVHYETLSRTVSRTAHAALCQQIPEDYRRYVIFELIDVPQHLPRIRLDDVLSGLRGHSRSIRCRVGLDWTGFDNFRDTGIDAFGVDITELELPEKALIAQLNNFCARVREAGFTSFTHGVNTTSLATSCVAAGVAQLDGDAVQASIDTIEHAYRYQPADLFTHLMKAKR